MPALISVAMTEQAVVERRKTVTRRLGWRHARVGQRLTCCRKVQGRRRRDPVTGVSYVEPLVRLADVEVVDVRAEPLRRMVDDLDYGHAETTLEGFPPGHPHHDPAEFCRVYFVEAQGVDLDHIWVTRLEWRYLTPPEPHPTLL